MVWEQVGEFRLDSNIKELKIVKNIFLPVSDVY